MNDEFIKVVMNPTRQRILEYLILHETGTVSEMSAALSDIPRPSIYRHIKIMSDCGIIEIASEKRVRGTVEKTYVLSDALKNNKSEADIPLIITQTLFSVMGSFSRYFSKPDFDIIKDMLCLTSSTLMMSDDEFADFMMKFSEMVNANILNKPDGKRKPRNILFASVPVENDKKGE